MRKDPTEFRERFRRWKDGEQVYEAGLPKYEDGIIPYQKYIDATEDQQNGRYLQQGPWNNPIVQFFDPTGVSGYPQVKEAFDNGNAYDKAVSILGAIPLLGKLKSAAKAGSVVNIPNDVKSYLDWDDYYRSIIYKDNKSGSIGPRKYIGSADYHEFKSQIRKGEIRKATPTEIQWWYDWTGGDSASPGLPLGSAILQPFENYKHQQKIQQLKDKNFNGRWFKKHENGKLPKYADGLTPYNKRDVNTNQALYNSEEDLYSPRYTLPEVTITGNKNKVGTGMGERLYMHPWKTVGDLSREQHQQIELDKATWGGEEGYAIHKDLIKPLSPVDPIGEFVVGGTVTAPLFTPLNPILKGAIRSVATSSNPVMQYVRYPIGKMLYGFDAQFPTVYRKIKSIPPKPKNGEVQISNPTPRFAFESSGEESPVITNFTYDAPVRKNSGGDWDSGLTLAMPGRKALLGKRVISTEPSDTFTYGNNIKMPTKDITLISGDLDELSTAKLYGYRTHTSQKLQQLRNEGIATEYIAKDDFSKYAKQMEFETRELFRSPTKKDVDFMNFVLQPKIKGQVYDPSQLDYLIKSGVEPFGDKFGNAQYRYYLLDGDRWRNLLYDPATYAESDFRKQMGIVLKKRIPLNKRKWM